MILTFEQASEILNISVERLEIYSRFDKYKKFFIDGGFDDSLTKEFKYFWRNQSHNQGMFWTEDSTLCYKHKMICKTCPNNFICTRIQKINGKPPIKWKVLELYAELGKPRNEVQDVR